VGGVIAIEHDRAAIGLHETDDHVEGGGLAGTVRAEEADDFAFFDLNIDAVHDGAAVVDFFQPWVCSRLLAVE
jgi:hypothetical protein